MGRGNIIPILFCSFELHAVFFIYGFRDRILRARHACFITIYNIHSCTDGIILLLVKIQTLWTFEVGPNSIGKILLKMNTVDEYSNDGEKHTPCLRLAKKKLPSVGNVGRPAVQLLDIFDFHLLSVRL